MSGSVQKIFELLKQNNLTAKQVSKDTGISASNFTEWKKGRNEPGIQTIKILADYFNVSADYLLEPDTGDVVSSGSNNNIQNGNNNNIEITTCDYDINEKKLIEKFRELDYDEQIQLMAEVIERVKGKEQE